MRWFKRNPAPTLNEASDKLNDSIAKLDAKIEACNNELAKINAAGTKTNAAFARQKAMQVLQRRKMYESQRDTIMATMVNVDRSEHVADQIQNAILVKDAYTASLRTMKRDLKRINLNKIENLKDNIEDLQDMAAEISETLGRHYEVPQEIGDDELEYEFAAIQNEQMQRQLDETAEARNERGQVDGIGIGLGLGLTQGDAIAEDDDGAVSGSAPMHSQEHQEALPLQANCRINL